MCCEGSKLPEVGLRLWDGSKGSSKGILKVPEGVEALPFQADQKVRSQKKKNYLKSLNRYIYKLIQAFLIEND